MLNYKQMMLTLVLAFSYAITAVAAPPPPACKGANILEDLKAEKPNVYKEIHAEADAFKNGKSLLWRIEKDGSPESYLFGTVHITDPRVHALPKPVAKAFDASRLLILEAVDLNEARMSKAIMSVFSEGLFSPSKDKHLDHYLTADELAKAVKISKGMGVPANFVKLMKPWLVAISLALPACEMKRAKAGLLSLDAMLEARAKKAGKPAIGLETPEEQLLAMASLPIDAQVAWLKSSIEQYDRSEDYMETMVQLYLKRQIGALLPLSILTSKDPKSAKLAMESFQKQLLTNRNINMVARSEAEIDKGGAFIGIGAMHLGGDDGLVELFRKAGYKVTSLE